MMYACISELGHHASVNWVIIGPGNGLVPNRWQAITWTNNDRGSWCHMVSLCHNGSVFCKSLCLLPLVEEGWCDLTLDSFSGGKFGTTKWWKCKKVSQSVSIQIYHFVILLILPNHLPYKCDVFNIILLKSCIKFYPIHCCIYLSLVKSMSNQ